MTTSQRKVSQKKDDGVGRESLTGCLKAPLMDFNLAREIALLHDEEAWMRTGRNSSTLVSGPESRIVLIALQEGSHLEDYGGDARLSIYTLSGHVTLRMSGRTVDLLYGHLFTLDRAIGCDVEAIEESALLLTVSLPHDSEIERSHHSTTSNRPH